MITFWIPYTSNAPWATNTLQRHVGASVRACSWQEAVSKLNHVYAQMGLEIRQLAPYFPACHLEDN